ncbi:hypothetical protein WJX74_010201 [Apatococcus lobatus]|uniref:Uncharacterized protein n=1 Tax=Apatococcus lobatus TaxID=904363 RepID=A0AAW1QTI6_9CHLO
MGAADVLKGFAQARESAFFKMEQEVDLQRHHSRLVNAGRLEQMAGANLRPRRMRTFEESVVAFEVLPEVLQQQARIEDPTAASRREFVKKIRGMPSRLTDAEMLQYRSTVYGVASTVGHIPRMHMGRHRWTAGMEAAQAGRAGMLQLPPEALEAGQRVTSAGARSAVYGTMLAVSIWAPVGHHAQQHIVPWRLWLQEKVGRVSPSAAAVSAATIPSSLSGSSPAISSELIHPHESTSQGPEHGTAFDLSTSATQQTSDLEPWPRLHRPADPQHPPKNV